MRAISTATPQRGGGGENDVVSEHHIEELPCALTGLLDVSWEGNEAVVLRIRQFGAMKIRVEMLFIGCHIVASALCASTFNFDPFSCINDKSLVCQFQGDS
ncbi:hypothetical protein Prudu_013896 [Prunus dulcis]|uniref:Uncharacterized protein n=1 Tax=Prunus dulcis TaxID=3755 RepID=A0A4Y1RFT2_PRUDU|nr:hypothetical protein Prudu_013896 [Prunus dulcis]